MRWLLLGGTVAAIWVIYVLYMLSYDGELAPSPRRSAVQMAAAVATIVGAVAALVTWAVQRLTATACGRYRDGYAEGYVDGVADRQPARALRVVR